MFRVPTPGWLSITTCLALTNTGCELDEYLEEPSTDAGLFGDADVPSLPIRPVKSMAGRAAPIRRDDGVERFKSAPTKDEPDAGAADAGEVDASAADGGCDDTPTIADTVGITSRGRLVRFDGASGELTEGHELSGLAPDESVLGADIRPANGQLYAVTDHARLYTIDLSTGTATFDAELSANPADTSEPFTGLRGARFGVDWNPVADRLRVVSDQGQNLRIQTGTGLTTTDGAINPHAALTAAAYTQSFAATCRTRLFVIDSDAKQLFLQNPPNDGRLEPVSELTSVGPGELHAFEIQTQDDGDDRAVIAVGTGDQTQLFDLDLTSGAASHPRTLALDEDEALIALSAPPPPTTPVQAPGELLALSESGRLISFNRAAPARLCTSQPITGLHQHEQVLGMDVRPADGMLYALGSAGKLYTLDVPTGQARFVSALSADPLDTSDPFQGLHGHEFAVAFNPVPDRLRVLSDQGQNLRIQVTTGSTISDGALSGASAGATAAAYTNAFAGATSTTLFAIDSDADALVRIGADPATGGACLPEPDAGNPNCGVASLIGPLGLGDLVGLDGFDIDGDNGNAFAALSIAHAELSTLYAVDLMSGTATLPPGVANATIGGGERVRGLTLAAK